MYDKACTKESSQKWWQKCGHQTSMIMLMIMICHDTVTYRHAVRTTVQAVRLYRAVCKT